jgi:DNA polymerase IV
VERLPVGQLHGVGPATETKMHRLGLFTGADLRAQTLEFLVGHFGKAGRHYHLLSRAIDDRPMVPERDRKSAGAENTFIRDLTTSEAIEAELRPLSEKVWRTCEKHGLQGRIATLKVTYADFRQITRSRSSARPVASREELDRIALHLLRQVFPLEKGVRLVGVSLSGFSAAPAGTAEQLALTFAL